MSERDPLFKAMLDQVRRDNWDNMNKQNNQMDDAERLPGVTFTLDDFASPEDFLDFVSGDVGVDVDGVARGFLLTETVEALIREGWSKSAISAVQVMANHWLERK